MSGNQKTTDDNIAFLKTAGNVLNADMTEAMLKDNGIPVFRQYHGADLHFRIIFGRVFQGIDMYVPAVALNKAKELVEILFNSELDFDDEIV